MYEKYKKYLISDNGKVKITLSKDMKKILLNFDGEFDDLNIKRGKVIILISPFFNEVGMINGRIEIPSKCNDENVVLNFKSKNECYDVYTFLLVSFKNRRNELKRDLNSLYGAYSSRYYNFDYQNLYPNTFGGRYNNSSDSEYLTENEPSRISYSEYLSESIGNNGYSSSSSNLDNETERRTYTDFNSMYR